MTIWLLIWIIYFDYGPVQRIGAEGYQTEALCNAAKVEFVKTDREPASSVWCFEVKVRDTIK